jgi:hypothetical protein
MTSVQALGAILLGSVLGTAGQGIRSIVVLKAAKDATAANPTGPAGNPLTSRLDRRKPGQQRQQQ